MPDSTGQPDPESRDQREEGTMTATLIDTTPIDVTDDLNRAREVVATARSDAHTALIAHTALLTVETLASQVAKAEAALRQERDEWAQWVHFAVERSQEVANDNDWCGVFDATMERLGLPPRSEPEPEDQEVAWWCDVTLRRTLDDDDVLGLLSEEMRRGRGIEVEESAVVTVEIRVSSEWTTTAGDCVCGDIDDDQIRYQLPDDFAEWEIAYKEGMRCDND